MMQRKAHMTRIDSTRFLEDEWFRKFNPEKRVFTGEAYLFIKRLFDLALVILSSPFWLPVMILIALIIRITSPGAPVFFVQQRTGRGGRRFSMYKFRSMVPNAEALKGSLAKLNADGELDGPLKLEHDPRITKIGRILRKTSLDEIPQLFNVLRGEMSLVGPRPTSWGTKSYKLWHTERLDVVPGVTGLFQVCGRGSQDFDLWLRLDIAYIERASLWLDINILFQTVFGIFKQRGAR
jgi:lipopolysaccharide/colanic/teichoic acid biosynthesis glycosyltransferase